MIKALLIVTTIVFAPTQQHPAYSSSVGVTQTVTGIEDPVACDKIAQKINEAKRNVGFRTAECFPLN